MFGSDLVLTRQPSCMARYAVEPRGIGSLATQGGLRIAKHRRDRKLVGALQYAVQAPRKFLNLGFWNSQAGPESRGWNDKP